MTTELEKQFFDTFGIEPKCETRDEYHKHECYGMVDCDECASAIYPQITDKQYLELICLLSRQRCYYFESITLKSLKEEILMFCMNEANIIKHQVQAIFKESEQE